MSFQIYSLDCGDFMKVIAVKKLSNYETSDAYEAHERINTNVVKTFVNVLKIEYVLDSGTYNYRITVDGNANTYDLSVEDYVISIKA